MVNRPSGRASHGLPSYLPSFSWLVVELTVEPMNDCPPYMANRPLVVSYISCSHCLYQSHSSTFLVFFLSYTPSLFAKQSEKLLESKFRRPHLPMPTNSQPSGLSRFTLMSVRNSRWSTSVLCSSLQMSSDSSPFSSV